MDAVENALGRGLANKREFSDLKDTRTGQTNGAVFVLFLNERKSGQRSTAGVDVDIFQIEIADATIYSANRQQWQYAPLLGSDKLISCLPYEFRNKTSRE